MTNPINHQCVNGKRCNPGADPQTTEKPDTLCRQCTTRSRRRIEQLPCQHFQLHAMIADHPPTDTPTHRQPDSTVPLNTTIDALCEDIHHHTVMAAEIVADSMHSYPRYHHNPSRHIALSVALIAPNLDKLLDAQEIDIMQWNLEGTRHTVTTTTGTHITQHLDHLGALANHTLGQTRARTYRDIPCARCGNTSVGRWTGAENYDCQNCGTQWPETDIRRQDLILLERHHRGFLHANA